MSDIHKVPQGEPACKFATQDIKQPRTLERYEHLVRLLEQISCQLRELREDVDELDRFNKPFGDGWRPRRRSA